MTSTTHGTTRGQFLRGGAKGGLALVAGGSLLAATTGPALAADGDPSDVEIAKLAATAELLAVDFYTRCIGSGVFGGRRERYLTGARANEQDHYDALAGVLGDAAPKDLSFTYPDGTFDSAQSAAQTGAALETAFVGAYMGAVTALKDPGLKAVAAQIGANEAQHLTNLKSIAAGGELVPNPSLPDVLTAQEATDAVTPFLA
jgi:rubrerythrin